MNMNELKTALIEAHRTENWDLASKLSQMKEKLKKKKRCVDCGVRVEGRHGNRDGATRCYMHWQAFKSGRRIAACFFVLLLPLMAISQTTWSNVTFEIHAATNFPPGVTNLVVLRSAGTLDLYVETTDASQAIGSPTNTAPPPPSGFVLSELTITTRNDFSGFVGMQIQVGPNPVTVTALGRMMLAGNTNSHALKLVSVSDGTDVPGGATSIAMNGAVGQFQYSQLSAPVTLSPGGNYFLVSQETQNGDLWYDVDTTLTTSPVAQDLSAVWGYGPGHWYLAGSTNHCYVPLDFK